MTNLKKKSHTEKLLLPIGVDDYQDLIEGGYVYVDKTLLIKEFWETDGKVVLVTRPRRFGKTISLSMLKCFFEITEKSTSHLFEKSKIWQEEKFRQLQGTFPVICISFKDIKASSWENTYEELKELLAKEVRRTLKPLEEKLSKDYRKKYQAILDKTANQAEFTESLLFITEAIKECLGKSTIILIDEYDSPITYAYTHKFYKSMVDFMCNLLSKALKGNPQLHKGFMTGVVRTAKDGILSGLNNLNICTMLDKNFADKFGFMEEEVSRLLNLVNRPDKNQEVKSWYNGYKIAAKYASDPSLAHFSCQIYNPWSLLKYIESSCMPETYWANTGSTELLERLISETSTVIQNELKILLEGKALEKKTINQDVILLDLDHREVEPWSFLFFAGYITAVEHLFTNNKNYYTLAIPNEEIKELYKKLVLGAISKNFSSIKLETLLEALVEGEIALVNNLLGDFIKSFCSYHDLYEKDLESSLHLFVLGLLASLADTYIVSSNLESGYGRYDIMLCPKTPNANLPGVLLEFKKGKKKDLKILAEEALEQIKTKDYKSQLKNLGHSGKILCYGIASYKKEILVKIETFS